MKANIEPNFVGQIINGHKIIEQKKFSEGFAVVKNDKSRYNFINKNGNFLLEKWYDHADCFKESFAIIGYKPKKKRDDKYMIHNFVNKKGELLSKVWFYMAFSFNNGFAMVLNNDGFYNYIDKNGNLLSKTWFWNANDFNKEFALVKPKYETYNFIDKNGNIIFDYDFDYATNFINDYAFVKIKDNIYAIDEYKNFYHVKSNYSMYITSIKSDKLSLNDISDLSNISFLQKVKKYVTSGHRIYLLSNYKRGDVKDIINNPIEYDDIETIFNEFKIFNITV